MEGFKEKEKDFDNSERKDTLENESYFKDAMLFFLKSQRKIYQIKKQRK
ncbi:MAG: hypothetical protein MJ252_03445 [archaeon]|nr:hypothetical protein [archaeon]